MSGIDSMVSSCCKAFKYTEDITTRCSKCRRALNTTDSPDFVTVSVMAIDGGDNTTPPISSSTSFNVLAKRFSTDPTYELTSHVCSKCGNLCRIARDPVQNLLFICSNGKCRNVET